MYKKNRIDINEFKTDRKDVCPVCGRNIFSKVVYSNGKHEKIFRCSVCETDYKLEYGERIEDYIPEDTENYCDFKCSECRYYDCVRNQEECWRFNAWLEEKGILDKDYERLVNEGKLKPYIAGRKND